MYIAKFGYRHTATDAATEAVFALRNPLASGKKLRLRRLIWAIGFDGTSAASQIGYGLSRYTTADFTGGSSPTRINTASSAGTSVVADANTKTGALLTDTSVVYEGNFHECLIPTTAGTVYGETIRFDDLDTTRKGFLLLPGEGICVRLALVAVIGQGCSGSLWWDEVTA